VTPAQSQGRPAQKMQKTIDNKAFQQVANTIKFWHEADPQASKKKKYAYEAIFFTDLECPSCKEAYSLIKQATWLRVGVCHVPMPERHSQALEWAKFVETGNSPKDFLKRIDIAGGGHLINTASPSIQKEAEQRVARMRAAAQAAGVTEVPTLWVRSGVSMQMQSLGGIAGIKIILETLQ
jgi:protein-disulfide isomerase